MERRVIVCAFHRELIHQSVRVLLMATPGCDALMFHALGASLNSCSPWFIRFSVTPIAMVETVMAMRNANRCLIGVAPADSRS